MKFRIGKLLEINIFGMHSSGRAFFFSIAIFILMNLLLKVGADLHHLSFTGREFLWTELVILIYSGLMFSYFFMELEEKRMDRDREKNSNASH